MDIRPGTEIYGATRESRYIVGEYCGGGSFGQVFKAVDGRDELFAVKTLSTSALSAMVLSALQNEGKLATQIDHHNVLRVHYFHDGEEYNELPPYMIMEYAEGGTLQQLICSRASSNDLFTTEEIVPLLIALASGMRAVNELLVHRDVKPDNILIKDNTPKIADFGLSKVVGASTRSHTFKGINHIRYCAPEAWNHEANCLTMDMYSMGIVFFELCALKHPFEPSQDGNVFEAWRRCHILDNPEPIHLINENLPEHISTVITRMMKKNPRDRFSSWDEVLQALEGKAQQAIPTKFDLQSLVCGIQNKREREELARRERDDNERKNKEIEWIINQSFMNVINEVQDLIAELKGSVRDVTVELNKTGERSFSIDCAASSIRTQISIPIIPAKLKDSPIMAWGTVRGLKEIGFNLILIKRDQHDMFGEWMTLHVRYSALSPLHGSRHEPFFFSLEELPNELELLSAVHVYRTEILPFSAQLFVPLLKEALASQE